MSNGDDRIGDDGDEMDCDLSTINLGTGFVVNDVKLGNGFTCASSTSGGVKCFGRNDDGQLGYGDTEDRGDDSGEMGDNLDFVDLGDGFNASRTSFPTGGGGAHTVVVSDDLDLKAWGRNRNGQLGNGGNETIGDDEDEMGDNLEDIDVTRDPTKTPTTDPTGSPTAPTPEPTTASPTAETSAPTEGPTTAYELCSCCTLDECIADYGADAFNIDIIYGTDSGAVTSNVGMLFGAAIIVVALAAVYAVASSMAAAGGVVKVAVDDGKIWSAAVVGLLLIDFYSDITFAIHLGAHFSAEDTGSARRRLADELSDEKKYYNLMVVAVVFIVVSYLANIASMVTMLLRVLESKMTSIYTKRYFQGHSQFYIAMVFASGDCFMPFWLISSNLFGIPLLNSGLSLYQRERYRLHHVVCVLLLRNIPLFVIECYFMFNLGIFSAIVIIGFLATMFSIAVSAVMMLNFYVINKRQIELPFTIQVSWEKRRDLNTLHSANGDGDGIDDDDEKETHDAMVAATSSRKKIPDKDAWWRVKEEPKEDIPSQHPLRQMGRRNALAVELEDAFMAKLDPFGDNRVGVEVMSTTKQNMQSVLVHAAIYGMGPESAGMVREIVANLEEKDSKELITEAVMKALVLKPFDKEMAFTVNVWSKVAPSALIRDSSTTDGLDATSPHAQMTDLGSEPDLIPTESNIIAAIPAAGAPTSTPGHSARNSTAL